MKAGLAYPRLYEEVKRQHTAKTDYLVKPLTVEMDAIGGKPMLRVLDSGGIDQLEPLDIQETAHLQMSQYLDIPWRYYKRLLNEDHTLLTHNVNRCIQKGRKIPRLLRTLDGSARAFLSNRYRRIENQDVFNIVMPVLEGISGLQFESCQLTPDHMFLKVVNPRLTGEVRLGDVVQFGIMISNSETGRGSLSISPMVYRLVCLNGMTVVDVQSGFSRQYHAGRVLTSEKDFCLYPATESVADDKEFVQKVQEAVLAAMDEGRFIQLIDRMKASAEIQLNTEDLSSVVKLASANFRIREVESEGVLQHLMQDADYTLYGLANAVTRHSQDVDDYDRASKLEAIGYDVMTMAPAMLRRINEESAATAAMAA